MEENDYGRTWSQDADSIEVSFFLKDNCTKNDVNVNFTSSSLSAGIKGEPPIIEGTLFGPVECSDSLWQLEDSSMISPNTTAGESAILNLSTLDPDVSGDSSFISPQLLRPDETRKRVAVHLQKSTEGPWPVLMSGPIEDTSTDSKPETVIIPGIDSESELELALFLWQLADQEETVEGKKERQESAKIYLESAAEKGDCHACIALAHIYRITQRYGLALKYGLRAAESGDLKSIIDVSDSYRYGQGVNVNLSKALEYMKKALEISSRPELYYKCGEIEFLRKNGKEAKDWFTYAADYKFAPACLKLAEIACEVGENERALSWYEHAIDLSPDSSESASDKLQELVRKEGKKPRKTVMMFAPPKTPRTPTTTKTTSTKTYEKAPSSASTTVPTSTDEETNVHDPTNYILPVTGAIALGVLLGSMIWWKQRKSKIQKRK